MAPFMALLPPALGGTAAAAGSTGVTAAVGAGVGGAGTAALAASAFPAAATAATGGSLMSVLPMAMMAGSSLLEGFGQSQSNKANAEISEAQAKQARLNAAYNERRQREVSNRMMGEQQARWGASGVAMEGTPLLFMADQAREAELEALAIRNEGKQASEMYKAEASQYKRAATSSLMGGLMSAAGYGAGSYLKYKGKY